MGHPALTHIQEAGVDVLRASNTSGPQSHPVHVICEVTVKLTQYPYYNNSGWMA